MTRPTIFTRPRIPNVFIGGDPELPDGQAELDCCADGSNTLPDRAYEGATYYGVLSGLGTLVQSKIGTDAGGGSSLAFDSDTTAGNLLVAVLVDRGGTTGPFSLSGWTFIEDAGKSGASEVTMFWRVSPGGPVTVSFNPPTNEVRIYIMEFEGGAAGLATTPTTHSGGGSVSSFPVGSLTVAGSSLLVGAVEAGNGVPNTITYTEDAAFTNVGQGQVGGALDPESIVGYRVVTAGSYNYTPTGNNSSSGWGGILAPFDLGEGWAGGGYLSVDGDDSTYTEIGGTNVLRIDLGDDFEIGRIRLYLATETAGSRTYTLKGATQPDFSDAVTVATLNFTATGSFTAQEVTASWTPTAAYEFWELTGDDETRYLYSFELYESITSVDTSAVEAALDDHITDPTDAHDASAVSIADSGGYYTGTDVEAALQELGAGGGGGSTFADLGWFNVVDYGAVGDNSTDDSAAIQDALDACAAAGGGTVFFPDDGTNGPGYYVGATLVDTSGYNSILKIPNTGGFYAMKLYGGSRRVYIRSDWNGTVSGNPAIISAGLHDTLTINRVFLEADNFSVIAHLDPKITAIDMTAAGTFRWGLNVGVGVNGDKTAAVPTHSNAIGVDLPWAINDMNTGGVGLFIEGYYYGIRPSEQMVSTSIYVSYCKWLGQLRGSVGSPNYLQHACYIGRLNDWYNTNGFEVTGDKRSIVIALWDIEQDPSPWTRATDISDASGYLYGSAAVQPSDYGGAPNSTFTVTGGGNFSYHIIPGDQWRFATKVDIPTGTDPSTNPSNGRRLYAASATGKLTGRTSAGATVDYEWGTGYGTPAVVLGTAAAAGSATTAVRTDATIVAFDATVPVTQAFGDSAATGSAAVAARRDHKHGMPSSGGSGIGEILIVDSPSTPLVFADLVQNDDQNDLLYADP